MICDVDWKMGLRYQLYVHVCVLLEASVSVLQLLLSKVDVFAVATNLPPASAEQSKSNAYAAPAVLVATCCCECRHLLI